jgi:hypothetical protein
LQAVAISGYAALGDNTPYNILTGPGGNGWSSSQVNSFPMPPAQPLQQTAAVMPAKTAVG